MEGASTSDIKRWAVGIVAEVSPEDTFVVEEGFDSLASDWDTAVAQDEGRFISGAEIGTFAALIVPFLMGFFGDLAKDVVKDAAKRAIGPQIDRLLGRKADAEDVRRLKGEVKTAIEKSRFPAAEKKTLQAGFDSLFAKIGAAR